MHSNYSPGAQIFAHFINKDLFSSHGPSFRKVDRITQKWPWDIKGQKYPRAYLICPRGPFLVPFAPQLAVLSYSTIQRKLHRMTPKWPWYVCGQRYPYAYYIHPRRHKFRPFRSTTIRSQHTTKLWENCTKWPQNDLNTLKVKSTHVDTTYTLTPKCSSFSPYHEPLSTSGPITKEVQRMTSNDLADMLEVTIVSIVHICLPRTCRSFDSFALWWTFSSCGPNVPNNSKMALTWSRSKVPICLPHNLKCPDFVTFATRWAFFELQPHVGKGT